jgi:mono/diheme cytochrome c family protein
MMMLAIAAVFAALMAGYMKPGETRTYVVRTAGRWGLAGIVLGAVFGAWYYFKLPATGHEVLATLPYVQWMFRLSLIIGFIMAAYFGALMLGRTGLARPAVAISMVVILFLGIGGGESVREFSRRPWLIPGIMYSNQVIAGDLAAKGVKSELARYRKKGFLAENYFVPAAWRTIDRNNYLKAGMLLTKVNCSICHTMEVNGRNSLPRLIRNMGISSAADLADFLDTIGDDYSYMPSFAGNAVERRAAAAYMATIVPGNQSEPPTPEWILKGDQ